MSTETAEIEDQIDTSNVGPAIPDDIGPAADRWEEAQKAATAPAAKADAKVEAKPNDSGIPDELLSGKAKEVDPDAGILDNEPTGPIKHEHFKKVQAYSKAQIAAAKKENEEMAARIKEIDGRGSDDKTKAELEQLRKDRAEMESELERLAFERSPRFQKQFVAREKATIDRATKAFTDAGGEASLLPEILAATPARRFAMLDELEMSGSGKQYVISVLSEHDAIQSEKAAALSESRERLSQWQNEDKAQQEAAASQRTVEMKKLLDRTIIETATEFEPFRKVDGNDKWNAEVDERITEVHRIAVGESTEKEIVQKIARGVAADRIHQMFRTVRDENTKLKERIASLEAAQPGAGGRAPAVNGNADETPEQRWERNQANAMTGR